MFFKKAGRKLRMKPDPMEELERRIGILEEEVKQLKESPFRLNAVRLEVVEPEPQPLSAPTKEAGEASEVKNGKTLEFKEREEQSKQENLFRQIPTKEGESVDWEHLIGRVWLPRVFIFVLLLGVIFAFSLVAIAGTDLIRVIMGFGLAGLLLWIGEKQIQKQRDGLGKVLLSGSVSTAILTTYAMHVLYGMVPAIIALILNIVWITIGIKLAEKHKSEAVAILTAGVGYLVPFLIDGNDSVSTLFIGYETVFYALLLRFAVQHGYKRLFYTSSILWHLVVGLYVCTLWGDVDWNLVMLTIAFGAIAQHLLLGYFGIKKEVLNIKVLPLMFASFVITTYWASAGLQFEITHEEQMVLTPLQVYLQKNVLFVLYLFLFAAGYGFLAYKGWKVQKTHLVSVALCISTLSIALLVYQVIEDSIFGSIIYLVQGTLAIHLSYRLQTFLQKVTGIVIYSIGVISVFIGASIETILSVETLAWIGLAGTLYVLYRILSENHPEKVELSRVLLGVNALVHLVFLTSVVAVITEEWSISLQMLTLSFSWVLYAVVGVVIGVLKDKKSIRIIGVILLFITLSKIIVVDLQYVTLLIRTILFIGLGTTGLLVSRLFYSKK